MDDEAIELLIGELQGLLVRKGFAWAVADAEDALYPNVAPRTRALALIDAAEAVTIDIAQIEMAADDAFDGEGIRFTPDEDGEADAFGDVEGRRADRDAAFFPDAERLQGAQRRAAIEDLAGRRAVFAALRERLDGND